MTNTLIYNSVPSLAFSSELNMISFTLSMYTYQASPFPMAHAEKSLIHPGERCHPTYLFIISHTRTDIPDIRYANNMHPMQIYRPGGGWFIICACCSWNLCPMRSLPAMNLLTHRDTQPVSRATRDLVVKSSTQDSKQWLTRLENI